MTPLSDADLVRLEKLLGLLSSDSDGEGATAGAMAWKFDLGKDPAISSPGMVYGGVTVHGGKLVLATCNLDGPLARKPTAIVCLGSK